MEVGKRGREVGREVGKGVGGVGCGDCGKK